MTNAVGMRSLGLPEPIVALSLSARCQFDMKSARLHGHVPRLCCSSSARQDPNLISITSYKSKRRMAPHESQSVLCRCSTCQVTERHKPHRLRAGTPIFRSRRFGTKSSRRQSHCQSETLMSMSHCLDESLDLDTCET